jgi:signal transduction histidine kinase
MFVENMRDGAATVSSTGLILFANRRLGEILSCGRDTIVGAPLARFLSHEGLIGLNELAGPDGLGVSVEVDMHDADGERIPVLIGSTPLIVDDHAFTCLTFHDLRAQQADERVRRSLEERLNQADRLDSLGQLAGGIAHDFNNLLAIILSYAEFAADETTGTVRGHIDKIAAAAERAARLTKQLLIVGHRETVHVERLDLNLIVREMSDLLSSTIGEHIELRTRADGSLSTIRADRGRIDQILLNLAVNARDAMPDGGTLTIETRRVDAGHVQLSVNDTGAGMSAEIVSHVFEPFFTTKPVGQGTGLGLATVYGIVTDAGGTVTVDSEEGVGTTVRVCLPSTDEPDSQPRNDAHAQPLKGGGETILVVEDEPELLAITTRILQRHGYEVLSAASGPEALALAAHHDFDLLLTDSVMPTMSGTALTDRLRETRPDLTALFMSGYSQDVLGPRRLAESGVTMIQKPWTATDLLVAVASSLAERGIG